METGLEVNLMQMIPLHQSNYLSTGHCTAECTRANLPKDGVRIFAAFGHTHLTGRKVRTRHVRNGIELPLIIEDNKLELNLNIIFTSITGGVVSYSLLGLVIRFRIQNWTKIS